MNNIILIGMSGAGKSTLGVLLAKALNYGFVDTDILIQQKYSSKLQDIIMGKGLDIFLEYEERVLLEFQGDNKVIATGGSVIYSETGMEHLKSLGRVVFLKVSREEIIKRLKDIRTRGIVMKPNESIGDVYDQRLPLYEKYADLSIDIESESLESTLQRICQLIEGVI